MLFVPISGVCIFTDEGSCRLLECLIIVILFHGYSVSPTVQDAFVTYLFLECILLVH